MGERESAFTRSVKSVYHVFNGFDVTAQWSRGGRWGGRDLGFHTGRTTEPHVGWGRGGVRRRHRRTRTLHAHLPAPQRLEGRGQPGRADVVRQRGDGRRAAVGREPVLLQPLADEVGVVVVAGHGQLGLQQHRVDVGVVGVGQQLAQVLLVEAGVEEVGVGVAGRRLGRPHRDVGRAGRDGRRHQGRLPVRLGGPDDDNNDNLYWSDWRRSNSPILLVVFPDERGDVEAPERFLVWQFGWRELER